MTGSTSPPEKLLFASWIQNNVSTESTSYLSSDNYSQESGVSCKPGTPSFQQAIEVLEKDC